MMDIGGGLNFYGFAYPATGIYDITPRARGARLQARIRSRARHRGLSRVAEAAGRLTQPNRGHAMRKLVEYPTPSLAGARPALGGGAQGDGGAQARLPRAVRLAGDVGLQHRQRPLPLPDRRQCRVQRAGFPAVRRADLASSIRRSSPTTGAARRTGSRTCGPGAARFADSVADRLTELKLDRRQGRHRRPRRAARSGRLGAAQHVHAAAGAAAGRADRQSRGHAGEAPHREERRGDRDPRQGRGSSAT